MKSKINFLKDRPCKRIFSSHNYEIFNNKLSLYNWNTEFSLCSNVDACYNKFNSIIATLFEECFPLQKISRRAAKDKVWISKSLKISCKKKSTLYKAWLHSKNAVDRKKYLAYCKILSKLIKKAKSDYYCNLFDSKVHSAKVLCANLNNVISVKKGKDRTNGIQEILIDNKTITDLSQICEEFNKYFTNIGKTLDRQLPATQCNFAQFMGPPQQNSIFVQPVTSMELISLIDELKCDKSSNDQFINAKLLKACKNNICLPLMLIYNMSLSTGVVPDSLKVAKVIPLYKKGDNRIVSNYRPISLLSVFNKLLEKIVYKRVYNFFQTNSIFYKNQFGFRSNFSTTLAVMDVVDYCYENLDKGNIVLGLFIDLQKAFDTVNHHILLQKLYHYGIRGMLWNWFQSYLSNRKQFTCIGSVKSTESNVEIGVPQGSCLGPLLFLIYMNDIGHLSETIKLFADDTNLFISSKNIKNIENDANALLSKMQDWFLANRLSINIDKTCYSLFSSRNKCINVNLKFGGITLKRVSTCKYLGIFIDEKLTWKEHINFLYSKLVKFTAIFYKIRDILPAKCLRQLYFSFVYPHLLFGVEIYANCANSTINCLNVLNNKIIRILLSVNRLTHVPILYKRLNVLPIAQLHHFNILLFVHKFVYDRQHLPEIFHLYFNEASCVHSYSTRNKHNFHTKFAGTKGKKCIKIKGSNLWNLLPDNIKCLGSQYVFKKQLKSFLFSDI